MHAGGACGGRSADEACDAATAGPTPDTAGRGSGRSGSSSVDGVCERAVVGVPDDVGVKRCCGMMHDRRGRDAARRILLSGARGLS